MITDVTTTPDDQTDRFTVVSGGGGGGGGQTRAERTLRVVTPSHASTRWCAVVEVSRCTHNAPVAVGRPVGSWRTHSRGAVYVTTGGGTGRPSTPVADAPRVKPGPRAAERPSTLVARAAVGTSAGVKIEPRAGAVKRVKTSSSSSSSSSSSAGRAVEIERRVKTEIERRDRDTPVTTIVAGRWSAGKNNRIWSEVPPLPVVPPHGSDESWKKLPPEPALKAQAAGADAISLTWQHKARRGFLYAAVVAYELYVFTAPSTAGGASYAWRKMDDLPVAAADQAPAECVLLDCPRGTHYLAVRAVDRHDRRAPFVLQKVEV